MSELCCHRFVVCGMGYFVSVNKCVLLCCHICVMYGYGSLLSVGIRVFGCVITDMCGMQALVIFYQ